MTLLILGVAVVLFMAGYEVGRERRLVAQHRREHETDLELLRALRLANMMLDQARTLTAKPWETHVVTLLEATVRCCYEARDRLAAGEDVRLQVAAIHATTDQLRALNERGVHD